MNFGERLKQIRANQGLSQEQLAEKIGVSRQAITKWETNRGLPDVENMIMLAEIFKVTLDELILQRKNEQEIQEKLFESETVYDIDCDKRFDIRVGSVRKICICTCDDEKIHIKLQSDFWDNLNSLYKVKIDEKKKRLDIDCQNKKVISQFEAEKSLEPDYASRGIRLDIIVADDKNTHYNLEMQVNNIKNPDTKHYVLPKRTRYYQALMDIDLLQKGQEYDLLPPTYIIFICVFDFFAKGNYVYTFKKRCLEDMELELPDEATTMILNTKGTHGNISKDIKSFYDYVNNHIINSDFTRQIDDEISYLKLDSKVRREFMLLEARLLDERREGKAEGEAKEKLATAKRLLSMGLSVQDVAKGTSLSVEQVEKIKAEQE